LKSAKKARGVRPRRGETDYSQRPGPLPSIPNSSEPKSRQKRPMEALDADEPRYLLGQVAMAAGISTGLLKAWMARKVVLMGPHDREAHGKGSSRVFTLKRALAVALAAEMVKLGISISLAGDISANAIEMLLEDAGGDVGKIDHLMAIYPEGPDGVRYGRADWDSKVEELLREDHLDDVSSVVIVSIKLLVEKTLRRLGEIG
jgi:hypothetical protein